MPEPTAACFPPSSVFFFLLLNVPFGETTGGELTSTSQTFLHYNHFSAWSRGKQKHRVKSRLEHQAWPISWFTTNKLEKSALMCLLTISSDVVGQHAVTLFDLRWFVVASSSLLHVINANERMHSHGFSHQSLRRFHSCFVFCIFLHMRSAFCIKPARWIYIHLPRCVSEDRVILNDRGRFVLQLQGVLARLGRHCSLKETYTVESATKKQKKTLGRLLLIEMVDVILTQRLALLLEPS